MKKIAYVLYALLILAAIGLLVYDYLPDRAIESNTLTRAGLLIAGLVMSILKLRTRQSRRTPVNKKTMYANAYPKYIQNVFSDDKKAEKLFFDAVEDYNADRPAAGVKKLEKLLAGQCHNSADRYAVTVFLALCLDDMGAYEQSARHYRAALSIRPDSTLWSNLGLALDRLGRAEESEKAYLQAVAMDPGNANPLNNLAQRCIRLGLYEEGRNYARQALAINPKFPQALSAMAICSHLLGDREGYEQYYRQAVANGYDGKKLKHYIQAMDPEF